MSDKRYTEEQRVEFLELAKDVGTARAIRELGYPSFRMAKQWAIKYGIELPLNELSQYVNDMKTMYGDEEKLYTGQLALDRITQRLNSIEDLAGDEIKKLAEAYKTTLIGMNLVQGKAMNINENRTTDNLDAEINAMLREQEYMNKQREESIE